MINFRTAAAILLTAGAVSAEAGELDINVNQDMVEAGYTFEPTETGLEFDASLLYNSDEGEMLGAGLHLVDYAAAENKDFEVGLGGKLYAVHSDAADSTEAALGLGANFRYTFPNYNRFSIAGGAHWAPDVLAFGDFDGFYEAEFRGEYAVLKQGRVYVGYRRIEADFQGFGDIEIDDGFHIGINLTF